ncbi:hypothetical protein M6B38_316620 [Iris pallida]|uniref:Uncharacterized protein n=1 Tax=Iris pallida TaxID=29817 RepID=A0AAX6HE26_IRIPA|nr:hypothetical protein M6B38_316620 [Iris pallida]
MWRRPRSATSAVRVSKKLGEEAGLLRELQRAAGSRGAEFGPNSAPGRVLAELCLLIPEVGRPVLVAPHRVLAELCVSGG